MIGENAIKNIFSKVENPFPMNVGKNAKIQEKDIFVNRY